MHSPLGWTQTVSRLQTPLHKVKHKRIHASLSVQEIMKVTMQGVLQLLPLLTACMVPDHVVVAAVVGLQGRVASSQPSTSATAVYFQYLTDAIKRVAAAASNDTTIEHCMASLQASTMQLDDEGVAAVVTASAELQLLLSSPLELQDSAQGLKYSMDTFSKQQLDDQWLKHDIDEVKKCLGAKTDVPTFAEAIPQAQILEVCLLY